MPKTTPKPFKLPKAAYRWALKHLLIEGDTDILPRPLELDAIQYCWKDLANQLAVLDLTNYEWHGTRRFLVPKERFAFRVATQLDPIDSIVLAALIKKYGRKIEAGRIAISQNRVFSYRFQPSENGRFYSDPESWHSFWKTSVEKAEKLTDSGWVAILDITDYYNQIYHHTLENQLTATDIPIVAIQLLMGLIKAVTHTVSRGIPVGPHSLHLLAECALIPTDDSLLAHGLDFCRYVDDIHVFCQSEQDAEIAVYESANILDIQQKLTLQRQKTRIMPVREFIELARSMLVDRPVNDEEKDLLQLLGRYISNPYVSFSIKRLTAAERQIIAPDKLEKILEAHLTAEPINFPRIRWLLRRLSQGGFPGAIEYVLRNIDRLTPALGDIARYTVAASENFNGNWEQAGALITNALQHPIVRHSDYVQVVLLNLFSRVPELDHINSVTAQYAGANAFVRREIVMASGAAQQGHWIRERKDEFATGDQWLRRAILAAAISLPGDEARHWLRSVKRQLDAREKIIMRWAFQDKKDTLKLGQIAI